MSHTIYAANGKVSHIHRHMFVYKAKEGRHVRIGNKSGFLSFLIAEKHVSYIQ